MERFQLRVFREVTVQMSTGGPSRRGLVGAGRLASKVAHAHGWPGQAGWWQKASVSHKLTSPDQLECLTRWRQASFRARAKWKPQCLL